MWTFVESKVEYVSVKTSVYVASSDLCELCNLYACCMCVTFIESRVEYVCVSVKTYVYVALSDSCDLCNLYTCCMCVYV
jgi:hypothetical protein